MAVAAAAAIDGEDETIIGSTIGSSVGSVIAGAEGSLS